MLARSLTFLVLFVGWISLAAAQDDDAVELGREALSKRSYPWYDPQQDAVRPLRLGKESATSDDITTSPSNRPRGRETSTAGFSLFGSALQVVGLVLLTLILAGVAALVVWAFLRNEGSSVGGARVVAAAREVDRVEQLPFALKAAGSDLLAEARRLAAAGDYSQAVVYFYSHLLVELDKHHVIRLAKGKTNRQYLRETRTRPALAATLETAMIAFEDVFFGKHPLPRERLEECLGQWPAFESELTRLERAAA